jgi:hypothetical protein
MTSTSETTIHDLLDPLTGQRRDLHFATVDGLARTGSDRLSRHIDGSDWWVLPAAVDADAHMPFVPAGLRSYDLLAALHGGVHHMVVALPYQLARKHHLPALVADLTRHALPAITPVLSVSPDAESVDFPTWLRAQLGQIHEFLPRVVKLYTGDPNFRRNLEAVREVGLKPAVFAFTPSDFDDLMRTAQSPLHIRHVTSKGMLDAVRSIPGATCQTSPHMALRLHGGRREALTVMPTPPDETDRQSLVATLGQVDVIASDHVSPPLGTPAGPGLQTQQHFVPALLAMAEDFNLDLERLWQQVTAAPASVFGLDTDAGSIVVDPAIQGVAGLWPRQRDDRAPYLGRTLKGRVLAVTRGQSGVMV